MAISTLAAVLEQKVWMMSPTVLHPNMFIMVIGHPGTGKSRTISVARSLFNGLPEAHLAPISITWAALVDCLAKSKRIIIRQGADPLDYQCLYICADEMGTFIHKYENEMVDGLSLFYNACLYDQHRRTNDLKVKITSGNLNLICGATPQMLSDLMPDKAWGQGFTSRVVMVFSDERTITDDFAPIIDPKTADLADDLATINNLMGQFHITPHFRDAVNNWKALGCVPVPGHPKLIHYGTRRPVHLYKLAMVSAIDRGNTLIVTREDFNRAMGWLIEAEIAMPGIFQAGATNADAQAMEEITHFITINDRGHGVSEAKIIRFARDRIPLHSILRVIEIMERSGVISFIGEDRSSKMKYYGPIKDQTAASERLLQ